MYNIRIYIHIPGLSRFFMTVLPFKNIFATFMQEEIPKIVNGNFNLTESSFILSR